MRAGVVTPFLHPNPQLLLVLQPQLLGACSPAGFEQLCTGAPGYQPHLVPHQGLLASCPGQLYSVAQQSRNPLCTEAGTAQQGWGVSAVGPLLTNGGQ